MATAKVQKRRAYGRFLVGPKERPARGVINFEASIDYIPDALASDPRLFLLKDVPAVLDAQGYLCEPSAADPTKPGALGVELFTTDSLGEEGQDWTWTARPQFRSEDGVQMLDAMRPFSFVVPAALPSVDLASVAKVPNTPGLGTEQAVALVTLVRGVADDAKEVALGVKARADSGEFNGLQGIPGVNAVPASEAVAEYAKTPGNPLNETLKAGFAPRGEVRLTVAASDSSPRAKARADYVCTGVGDLAVIQQALDALPDSETVSGEVELLSGIYRDATNATVAIGSPSSPTRNNRKILRFQRGARIQVTGRTGRKAVLKVEASLCQIVNPEIAGDTARGNGTGIAFGGDVATLGGRWDKIAYLCSVTDPILRNLATGVEFSAVDGMGSTGDCYGVGGQIEQCKTGVRAAGYVNRWFSLGVMYCETNVWVESRRAEAQLDVYGSTLNNWFINAVRVDGGAGSTFRDTWMEHTLDTGPATEAVVVGLSNAVRASNVRFSGKTTVQLHNESYAFRLVGSHGLLVDLLQISTSGTAPAVSILRNETSESSRNNRFDTVCFGPNRTPGHTLITGTGAGEVIVRRAPGAENSNEYTTLINRDPATSENPYKEKSSDESLTSVNMHNDAELAVTPQINATYLVTAFIRYEASQSGGLRGTIAVPGGASLNWQGMGPSAGGATAAGAATAQMSSVAHNVEVVYGGAGEGMPLGIRVQGRLTTVNTAGTVRWRWAQGSTNAVPAKVLAGSWIRLERVG